MSEATKKTGRLYEPQNLTENLLLKIFTNPLLEILSAWILRRIFSEATKKTGRLYEPQNLTDNLLLKIFTNPLLEILSAWILCRILSEATRARSVVLQDINQSEKQEVP